MWIYVHFTGCKLQTHVRVDEDYDRDLTDQIVGKKSEDVLSIEDTKIVYYTRDNNAKYQPLIRLLLILYTCGLLQNHAYLYIFQFYNLQLYKIDCLEQWILCIL